jgi:integrase
MKWADLDQAGVWTIAKQPREKDTGGALALPATALDIIRARPELVGNPHVFPGRGGDGPFRGFGASKAALDAKLPKEMSSWTVHDLRRSARSLMSRVGVRPDVGERVMGHAIRGVERVYDRHRYFDEKREALVKLAALIDSIVSPRGDKVVPMRKPTRRQR